MRCPKVSTDDGRNFFEKKADDIYLVIELSDDYG